MEMFKDHQDEFLKVARLVCPAFVIDNENEEVIEDLTNYFFKQAGRLNLKKGIWLEGSLGTGKTTLLRIFSILSLHLRRGFVVHFCPDIAVKYSEGESLEPYTYARNCYPAYPVNMAFDDLGREIIPACRYGSEMNVMQYILQTRYLLWQKQGIQTYLTTNCDAESVEVMYGRFIRDRRKEMFNIVVLDGESRRK